jgi:hypothetical protein
MASAGVVAWCWLWMVGAWVWIAGREGEAAKVGASVEAMTAERRGSAAWRWRSADAISPGEESAGSTGGRGAGAGAGAGGATAAVARGFAGGVLTILRERNEILVERSSLSAGGGTVAGDRERAGRPIKVSATYGGAGLPELEGQRSSQQLWTVGTKLCGPDKGRNV